jgi:hypothetical protein
MGRTSCCLAATGLLLAAATSGAFVLPSSPGTFVCGDGGVGSSGLGWCVVGWSSATDWDAGDRSLFFDRC